MRTEDECKKILSKIGFKLGVSPKLISTRLLSKEDKRDMLNGELSVETLIAHVKVWRDNKMPDYANGKFEPYKPIEGKKKFGIG
jgi:hypothetical protein